MPGIIYAAVAEGDSTVADHGTDQATGKVKSLVDVILDRISTGSDHKKSYHHEGYSFNYIVENEVVYLCVADVSFQTRIAFAFLTKIKQRYDGGDDFGEVIAEEMAFYNNNPSADKIKNIQASVDKVQDIMMENIENVLRRGEKIEDVLDRTDRMQVEAGTFRKGAVKLKKKLWWKNVKLNICILVILIILIFFIVVLACGGFTFEDCK
ncbi:Vesicle membrane receptor protein (v-SNARE) [Balamuthia mandrillaris]